MASLRRHERSCPPDTPNASRQLLSSISYGKRKSGGSSLSLGGAVTDRVSFGGHFTLKKESSMAWDPALESAFHPQSVAIVGASSTPPPNDRQWGGGYMFIRHFQELGFPGRIYPVNPKASTIRGLQAYPSLTAIPEPVDLVIVAVPARVAPQVLEDCIKANAKNVHMFTSGYSETGEEEGRQRERELVQIARAGGLRIIGPNCMGLHVPAARISTMDGTPTPPGVVGMVSQSGGHASGFIRYTTEQGIGVSKVISFGNGLILESTDFLEYLAKDPET
ncbi:MAG: hypothetical protein FJ315_08720, partial [SAR202 cluster bacterium]|nr:hypothetical protein [SAR202 cluster bacterium]